MRPIDTTAAIRRSVRRAGTRAAVMLALARLGHASAPELAEALAVTQSRLHMILYGHLPRYRHDLSPIGLGHVRAHTTRYGTLFSLTPAGEAVVPDVRAAAKVRGKPLARLQRATSARRR